MNKFIFEETKGSPIKHWTNGVLLDDRAREQLHNIASLPFIHKHVAAMPDVHWGMGATIGSVIATKGAIVPAAVGVDIGCGMMAYQTSLKAHDLPDNLRDLRDDIERNTPCGRTDNGGRNDKGAYKSLTASNELRWGELSKGYEKIIEKHPKALAFNTWQHLGTLGTGNHFIEICLDENDSVWVMLHSGSRGVGNKIGMYFIEKAKQEMEKYHIDKYLVDKDLSYLVEKTEIFDDYVAAVEWAQEFALKNRESMMGMTLAALSRHTKPFEITEMAVTVIITIYQKRTILALTFG